MNGDRQRDVVPVDPAADGLLDDDALLDQLLAEAGVAPIGDATSLRPRTQPGPAPLSFAQELLWLLDQASPGMTAYNIQIARRILGPLDTGALERGLGEVVARHEVLRTRFAAVDGRAVQIVDPPAPFVLQLVDLAGVAPAEREERTATIVRERVATPFDLTRDHLFRATIVRCGAEDHVLLLETHHIVCDGWSLGILFREIGAAYDAARRGVGPVFHPLEVQYADYAVWQRATLSGDKLARLIAYWRDRLGDDLAPLELPADFAPGAAPGYAGTQRSIVLEPERAAQVAQLAQRFAATPYMIVLAAYAAVLHRYTGRSNVLIGSSVAARMDPQTEGVVGFFNNILAMRADCAGDPAFGELVRRVRETCLGAYDHQDIPLEKLVLELRENDANLGGGSLFNVVLTSQNALPSPFALDGVQVEPYGVDAGATKFDLTLFMAETPAGLRLTLRARSELWAPATIERFLGHLRAVLVAAVTDPDVPLSQLELLTPPERATIARSNATTVAFEPTGIVPLIAAAAARVPTRVAVRDTNGSVTYAELARRASRLANRLRALGAGPGAVVGLMLERSVDAVVALAGILASGAAYVPLIPDLPGARLEMQQNESGCRIVVSVAANAALIGDSRTAVLLDRDAALLAAESEFPPAYGADPEATAYVLFTSGSTGIPKAVVITHANLSNYVHAIAQVLGGRDASGLAALDGWNVALTSTLGADLGNTALFPALCAGATLHVIDSETATDPQRFAAYATEHRLDLLKITPSHFRALLAAAPDDARGALLPSRWLVFGGERLGWDLVDAVERTAADAAARPRVLNHYGPTETTVGACTFELSAEARARALDAGAQSVPIGLPLANVHAYVRDPHGREMPAGVTGELVVAGAQVARGYLGRPELTAERFIVEEAERTYRTGDRVRRLPGGEIEFLGRLDTQVKVRGFRIELAEIEAVLGARDDVASVVADFRAGSGDEEGRIVAYVVPRGEADGLASRLRAFALEHLPAPMVPAAIVTLDTLPLTRNGKVDRAALPDPDRTVAVATIVAPRTPLEAELAALWEETFKREPGTIGVNEDFFALGGHSLLAIRVLGKISRRFGTRLALRTLFESPTIEQLTAAIDRARTVAAPPAAQIKPIARAARRSGVAAPGESRQLGDGMPPR